MPSLNPAQMRAAEDLISKLSAVMHYGECEGHEVSMTAFVATVQPPRPDHLGEEEAKLPMPDTELFFVYEDEWVLAEINPIGRSFR